MNGGDPLRIPKKGLNLIGLLAIFSFVGLLLLETLTLIAGVPVVVDGIRNPVISTESDLILPYYGCNESSASSYFEISPEINGTLNFVENRIIFTPNGSFNNGRIYGVKYGCGESINRISFRAEKPTYLGYVVVSDFREHIVIAFNMDVSRSDIERNISFEPSLPYTTRWYGNTLVMEPESTSRGAYTLTIKGNVSVEGKNRSINLETVYYAGHGILDFTGKYAIPEEGSTWTYIILPPGLPVILNRLSGTSFVAYFLFVVSAILISVGNIFIRDGRKIAGTALSSLKRYELRVPSDRSIFDIAALFFATISFTILFYLFIGLFETNPTVPQFGKMPLWEQMYELSRASVWEELITRIPFIGILLLIIHVYRGEREAPLYRYIIGGKFRMERSVMILIFLCAGMFGFVHMVAGWDVFKVLPAMVGGLAMGYLYAKWGIWASITLHFATNYLSMPTELFDSIILDTAIGLFFLGSIIIGIFFFYLYSKAFILHIMSRKEARGSGPGEPYALPPPYRQEPPEFAVKNGEIPYAQHPYRCHVCGNIEAEYLGKGLLKCTRCGSLSIMPPSPPDIGPPKV